MRRLLRSTLLCLLAYATPAALIAAERVAPPERLRVSVDPPGTWRIMRLDSATGDCIGNPVTPICATETSMACFDRGIRELCQIADPLRDPKRFALHPVVPNLNHRYRVDRLTTLRRFTKLQRKLNDTHPGGFMIGDVTVHVIDGECRLLHTPCPPLQITAFACTTRKTGESWRVLGCSGEGYTD